MIKTSKQSGLGQSGKRVVNMNAEEKTINVKLAILTDEDMPSFRHGKDITEIARNRVMDYKAAAAYAAAIIRNPNSYTISESGVAWKNRIHIFDNTGLFDIANTKRDGKSWHYDDKIDGTDEVPAVHYVMKAVFNAMNDVRKEHGFS
jgi:hypothetical protein